MNVMQTPRRDEGTAYEMRPASHKAELVAVTRGTPMGELLRRYGHPVGLAADAGDTPRKVRALGEDLVLFRDGAGKAGLVHARCCHRGTTLYYGKVEERGIRCCYHGWLFDTQGQLVRRAAVRAERRALSRQGAPALVSDRGALRADLRLHGASPKRKPVLPRYECLEVMDEGEFVEADDSSLGGGGPPIIPCNWLQRLARTWSIRSTCRCCTRRSAARSSPPR